jgi:hypothetical protein
LSAYHGQVIYEAQWKEGVIAGVALISGAMRVKSLFSRLRGMQR